MSAVQFIRPSDLRSDEMTIAAGLVYDAFPQYYDLLPLAHAERLELIVAQIGQANTEIADSTFVRDATGIVGVVSAIAATRLRRAQLMSVGGFFRALTAETKPVFKQGLRTFQGKVPPVPLESHYLSRIAVAERLRGGGLAAVLLGRFLSEGSSLHSLHVHSTNVRAIRFYERNGFKSWGAVPSDYKAMVRG